MKKFIILILFISACSWDSSLYRQQGFQAFDRSVGDLQRISDPVTMELSVTVHIVPDSTHMPCPVAAAGCASGNEIWVIGYRYGDHIVANQAVLGHELNHVLNFSNPEIKNPDSLRGKIMNWKPTLSIGDNVRFCGQHTDAFSVSGVIETIDRRRIEPYGIRFCNGNFRWASGTQLIIEK